MAIIYIRDKETGSLYKISGGGGFSPAAASMLIKVLRNGVYTTEQSSNITALAESLGVSETANTPDAGEPETISYAILGRVCTTYTDNSIRLGHGTNRMTLVCDDGDLAYRDYDNNAETEYYMLNIPEGATTLSINSPNNITSGVNVCHYDSALGYIVRDVDSGWIGAGTQVYDISGYNSGEYYVGINFKESSDGAVTESMASLVSAKFE